MITRPMEYRRELAAGWSGEAADAEETHVRDQLAAVADADDDPASRRDDVHVYRVEEPDGRLTIVGVLDAEPDAPYLRPGYDPFTGVDPELFAAEVEAAQRDEVRGDG